LVPVEVAQFESQQFPAPQPATEQQEQAQCDCFGPQRVGARRGQLPGGLKDARHLGFGDQARELRRGRLWKGQQVGNEGDRMISSV